MDEDVVEVIIGFVNFFENDLCGLELVICLYNVFVIEFDGVVFEFGVMDGIGVLWIDEDFVLIEMEDVFLFMFVDV